MNAVELMRAARQAAENAYAPYSRFRVGAALEMVDGSVVLGVNVENRSFGLSNCAERTALYTALTQGKRNVKAIAIAGPDAQGPLPPCGACRQVISEFCPSDTPVYFDDGRGGHMESTVAELYPFDSLKDLLDR